MCSSSQNNQRASVWKMDSVNRFETTNNNNTNKSRKQSHSGNRNFFIRITGGWHGLVPSKIPLCREFMKIAPPTVCLPQCCDLGLIFQRTVSSSGHKKRLKIK